MDLFVKDHPKVGEELIWTHGNGMTEPVQFVNQIEALVVPTVDHSGYANEPDWMATVVRLKTGKRVRVPLRELSRPK